ncbi:MAG: methionyl-tRNA formyltransferase [Pseudomonadota bacterium]
MRLAFMGTPDFAVPSLVELIAAGHDVVAVYTKAPRPAGRGQALRRTPVHEVAEAHAKTVRTPKSLKKPPEQDAFAALDLDAAIVVAYGLILPQAVLDAPHHGCFNLHASLLPRWRGAAPIHRAIMAGDRETGVQVMRMEAGLDTGPILLSETTPIAADDTTQTVHDRLAQIGAGLWPRALAALERGGIAETPQAESGVTYAEKITADEARIDWSRPAAAIDRHVRGLAPFPGAWFEIDRGGERLRVKALNAALAADGGGAPGTVLEAGPRFVVACGEGAVALTRLQRAGKTARDPDAFLRGAGLGVGDRLV